MFTSTEILSLWFGNEAGRAPKSDLTYIQERIPLWFGRNEEFEAKQHDLAHKYLDTVASWEDSSRLTENSALSSQSIDSSSWNDARGYLARVILFDQFPRCVFRATASAFKYDHIAVNYALRIAEDETLWNELAAVERLFLIVSIQHSEDLELQRKGVSLAQRVAADESEEVQQHFKTFSNFFFEHHDVIQRFGRFPGRNEVLNRSSTSEEMAWLESPECPDWSKSQMKEKK